MNFRDIRQWCIKEGRLRRVRAGNIVLWSLKPEPKDLIPSMTKTWWVSTNGSISNLTDPNWRSTDKLPVEKGAIVTFGLAGYVTVANVVAYNANGAVVGYTNYKGSGTGFHEGVYTVPETATHITITGHAPTNTLGSGQYAVLSYIEEDTPPRYNENGLVLWCDGLSNNGEDEEHSRTVTIWKDLSGNDNDIISTKAKADTTPASTFQGEWQLDGAYINAKNNQFLRTVTQFDLGADRTIEVRFTLLSDIYATFGFATGDRYKYRITSGGTPVNDWARTSESDTANIITVRLNKTATIGIPATMCITRHYNAATDITEYRMYLDGAQVGTDNQAGNHRAGDVSCVMLGNEQDDAIFHSVRVYDRALTADEVVNNYAYDLLRFSGKLSYVTRGMVLWCDGIDNTENGHDASVTTWKDLTGNGYDLINVGSKDSTTPATTVQGVWTENGITLNNAASQFVRSVEAFDLGVDRTLEMCVTAEGDNYAEIGLVHAERYKYRTSQYSGWFLISKEDASGYIITPQVIPPTAIGESFTVAITRKYNATTDKTVYDVYHNGKSMSSTSVDGDYRKGDSSILLFDDEKGHMTIHSVRLYNRVLTAAEIDNNYWQDKARFVKEG